MAVIKVIDRPLVEPLTQPHLYTFPLNEDCQVGQYLRLGSNGKLSLLRSNDCGLRSTDFVAIEDGVAGSTVTVVPA